MTRRAALSLLGSGLLLAQARPSPVDASFGLAPGAEAWVARTLDAMSLEEQAGQLLMPAIPAGATAHNELGAEALRLVTDLGVGAFTLRVRGAVDALELIQTLQASSEVPLLVNVNFERGAGTFWSEGAMLPRQMAFAATGDPNTARIAGQIIARECRASGVHWVSVPICDVNVNPENPIINIRSYGEDVETVRSFSRAFIAGCQGGGVMACAKHFPGHGDTAVDSHLELAVVDQPRARLDAVEFPPFRAAISAGVATVMTSHIWFPAIMPGEDEVPATLSRHVLTALLRHEMGFDGLVITDAMTMRGITGRWEPGEAAVAALAAGADVILDSPDNAAARDALVRAVPRGAISGRRLRESAERVLRAKAALGLHTGTQIDSQAAFTILRDEDTRRFARGVASRAITLLRDESGVLPINASETTGLLHLALYDDWSGWDFADLEALRDGLGHRFASVSSEVVFEAPTLGVAQRLAGGSVSLSSGEVQSRLGVTADRLARLQLMAEQSDVTVITAFVRTASYRASVGLGPHQLALIREISGQGRPAVLAILGSPYLAMATPVAPCVLLTYDDGRPSAEALPAALTGETAIRGRLPVTLPGVAARGDGVQIPSR